MWIIKDNAGRYYVGSCQWCTDIRNAIVWVEYEMVVMVVGMVGGDIALYMG